MNIARNRCIILEPAFSHDPQAFNNENIGHV